MAGDEPTPTMVDIAFPLGGHALPRDYRRALSEALEAALPWLSELPHAWLHRVNVSAGDGAFALLSGRSRVTLRVPRSRADDAEALAGAELTIGAQRVRLGAPRRRELLPHSTLYSHLVATEADDAIAFLNAVADELVALHVRARPVCGRRQAVDGGRLAGFSLMLDGLAPEASLRVLETGLGVERRLGCGLFVPHKSAVAVGA
jgi:CRISPR-associated protein Cas6